MYFNIEMHKMKYKQFLSFLHFQLLLYLQELLRFIKNKFNDMSYVKLEL